MKFNNFFNNFKEYIITFMISIILGMILHQFIGFTKVNGLSMFPTLNNKDFLVFTKFDKYKNSIDNGDIIVFDTTPNVKSRYKKIYYIKRVIGKAGDHILIKNGKVFLNGVEIIESYVDDLRTEGNIDIKIPNNKYFVLGDNRDGSSDSRVFGLVNHHDIVGVTKLRLFPFKSITML